MTQHNDENVQNELNHDGARKAAQRVVSSVPQLVPDTLMSYEDWVAWAQPIMQDNSVVCDEKALPLIFEAAETAIYNREPHNHWPDFTRAMRFMFPRMPADAVVFEVDGDAGGSDPQCPNTTLKAGRIVEGQLQAGVLIKTVAKTWLAEFCEQEAAKRNPEPEMPVEP